MVCSAGRVGGLLILETLTIYELHQCHPPSPANTEPRDTNKSQKPQQLRFRGLERVAFSGNKASIYYRDFYYLCLQALTYNILDMNGGDDKIPIGIQTFDKIIEGGYIYVDKTEYIYDIAHKYNYVFLSRPRRFGKSLLSSTFQAYFSGRKDLFNNLKAGNLEKVWKQHPVLYFDMSTAKHMTEALLLEEMDKKLYEYEQTYGRGVKYVNINKRLEGLVHRATEQTGEKAVIIIDEYDAPLLDVINDREQIQPMRQIMRNFYSPIKSLDPYLRFVFITGINKFAQLSIFSELNNLKNISMLPEYSAICGISQSELEHNFDFQIKSLSEAEGISIEKTFDLLKENYDGYHFCEGSEDIYNPFSLLNAFADKQFKSYWFETATPTYLLDRLDRKPIDEREFDKMENISANEFNVSPEVTDNPIPLLYQTGYLTIKSYDKETESYTLGYPNKEVRNGFLNSLLARYNNQDPASASFVIRFNAALRKGNVEEALSRMQSFLAAMPNDLENKTEKHYQTIIYLIFSLLGYYIRTEEKSAIGRADAVCWTDNSIYVFEFKVDSSAETALKQIDDKGYMIPFRFEDGKRLVKVGVNISTVSRTLEDWKIDVAHV